MNPGFPTFGRMQDGAFIEVLKNYTLPDFILKLIAKTCNSKLVERGRLYNKLQSMNDESLVLLHKIFVECKNDDAGKFMQYRFYAYVSSIYPKCEFLVNHSIPGLKSDHKVAVAIKSNGVYVAVAINKVSGNQVNKKDINIANNKRKIRITMRFVYRLLLPLTRQIIDSKNCVARGS